MSCLDKRDFSLRVGAATCLPALARRFGFEPAEALAAAGLEEALFTNPENRVSILKLGKFAVEIVRLIGRPDLGLLIAQTCGPPALGMILELAEEGPDVRTALLNIARLLKHHNECAFLSLSESGSDAILTYELRETDFEGADIILLTAIGNAYGVMRSFCGEAWRPAEVRLSMARPANTKPYEAFFSAPVRFDSTMDALVFSAQVLDLAVTRHPPARAGTSLPSAPWDFPTMCAIKSQRGWDWHPSPRQRLPRTWACHAGPSTGVSQGLACPSRSWWTRFALPGPGASLPPAMRRFPTSAWRSDIWSPAPSPAHSAPGRGARRWIGGTVTARRAGQSGRSGDGLRNSKRYFSAAVHLAQSDKRSPRIDVMNSIGETTERGMRGVGKKSAGTAAAYAEVIQDGRLLWPGVLFR